MSLMHYTNYYMADCSSKKARDVSKSSVLSTWNRLEWLSHCRQPSNLYSSVNAANSLQAFLCADFLQISCRGFISTQVFDSSRYCILHKEEDGQKQNNQCEIRQDELRSGTHIPRESLVEPSLPMMRYSFLSPNWPLHWRLLANTRMESSVTRTSPSEQNVFILQYEFAWTQWVLWSEFTYWFWARSWLWPHTAQNYSSRKC